MTDQAAQGWKIGRAAAEGGRADLYRAALPAAAEGDEYAAGIVRGYEETAEH